LKSGEPQGSGGSNPPLSVILGIIKSSQLKGEL